MSSAGKKVARDIRHYGARILTSEKFKEAQRQKHHFRSSVGSHTLRVTHISLRIGYILAKAGVHIDKKDLVLGAMCHDLGIVGREGKYANNRVCCRQHPLDSVGIAKTLVPEIDEKTEGIIRRHMWPLTIGMPNSLEGFIVSLSDKIASVEDVFRPYSMAVI